MGMFDDAIKQANDALMPHTATMAAALQRSAAATERLCALEESREGRQVSDLGRPDTGDIFHKIVRHNVKYETANKNELGGPRPGEIWLVQVFAAYGIKNKSPAFAIRTNTGTILAAVVAEGIGHEFMGGNIPIYPGETIFFEPEENGVFDFTLVLIKRKLPGRYADATGGISGEQYDDRARGEHESARDFSPEFDAAEHVS